MGSVIAAINVDCVMADVMKADALRASSRICNQYANSPVCCVEGADSSFSCLQTGFIPYRNTAMNERCAELSQKVCEPLNVFTECCPNNHTRIGVGGENVAGQGYGCSQLR